MDKEKVLDYVMNSPGNSNRAVLSGMLDESGGGNSDFSTAEVTFILSDIESADLVYNQLIDYEENVGIESVYGIGENATITTVLYKNKAFFTVVDSDIQVSTSGEAEFIEDEDVIIISGDCTITLSSNS